MDYELEQVSFKRLVAKGVLVIGIRRFLVQIILTVSNIVLARVLNPEIFGTFAIISFLILVLGLLTSFGLLPALVQKKSKPTQAEIAAIFTVIMAASVLFVVGMYFLAPLINNFYHGNLGAGGIFWLRIYAFYLLFLNVGSISQALLERELKFTQSTIGELVILTCTQAITIYFALNGFGVGSFVIGAVAGRIIGVGVFFHLQPWSIRLNFNKDDLKPFLPFGLNFQLNSIINATSTAIIPGFIGRVVGPSAVGFINWGGGVRQVMLSPSEVLEKLVFPASARAQNHPAVLAALIERMVELSSLCVFPLLVIALVLARPLTIIVYSAQWLPGLLTLQLSLVQGFFMILTNIMIQVLFALGLAHKVRNISLFWTFLQWALTIPLVFFWNYNGAVLAAIIVSATFFLPFNEVRKKVPFRLLPHILPYLSFSLIMGVCLWGLLRFIPVVHFFELTTMGIVGLIIYGLLVVFFRHKTLVSQIRTLQELSRGG